VKDKATYTKNRLQIPLPKKQPYAKYRVLLDDDGRVGVFYGGTPRPWQIEKLLAPSSPIAAATAAVSLMAEANVAAEYVGVRGSAVTGDYDPALSDVDLLVIVADAAISEVKELMRRLRPEIDVAVIGLSDVAKLGRGADKPMLLQARPIVDRIDLKRQVLSQRTNWLAVKKTVIAEISLTESFMEIITRSRTKADRRQCVPHIMARLRAVYLADCLLDKKLPLRSGLYLALAKYKIHSKTLRTLYVTAKTAEKGLTRDRPFNISTNDLLSVAAAIVAYGNDVVDRIAKS
jgi:predicted nucleotidyltransferase